MSISNEFTAPGPRQRPGAVTFGAYAQFAIFALSVLATIATIVAAESVLPVMADDLRTNQDVTADEINAVLSVSRGFIYVFSSVIPLYSLAVAILGIFVLKGMNGARVTTWVLAGIGLTCTGFSTVLAPLSMMSSTSTGGAGSVPDETNVRMEAAIPAWTNVVTIVSTLLAAVLYLGIIVLLALPASNEYFKKRVPMEQLPGAAFPAPPPPPPPPGPGGPSAAAGPNGPPPPADPTADPTYPPGPPPPPTAG